MTNSQISYILSENNVPKKTWVTLYGIFDRIQLHSDGHITISPKTLLFYFDNDVIYLKRLTGNLIPYKENSNITGYVVEDTEGRQYINKVADYGIKTSDENIGVIHEVVDATNVSGFIKDVKMRASFNGTTVNAGKWF